MEFVIFHALDAHRLKGSQADVEGDFRDFDAAIMDAGQNFRSEMKARGGSGDRSAFAGVDGLIAFAVGGRIGARDVGRERDVSQLFEDAEKVFHGLKADAALAEPGAGDHFGLQDIRLAEEKALSHPDFTAGAHQALPFVRIAGKLRGQQDLDVAVEEIARRGIARTERLRLQAGARP